VKPTQKLLGSIALVALLAGAFTAVSATTAFAGGDTPHKAYVCKYVGTPGNERLQTGQNPIDVDFSAIDEDPVVEGSSFADKQGRSLVLAIDTGQDESSLSCPLPPPTHVMVVAPSYTPGTCSAVGTVVATNTDQYTWAESGTADATYETASAVGNVVLDGQTVFGPYDLRMVTGDTCPSPPTCVSAPSWAYTYDQATGSGTITASGGDAGATLCSPLSVRSAGWTYDPPASGAPSWPQTLSGYNDTTVDKIGTFSYGSPQLTGCHQYDSYASFSGFSALGLPTHLLGSHNPSEPAFLHETLSGDGPNPTYAYTGSEGCVPAPTKVTPVTPEKTCNTDTNTPNPGFTAEQIAALQPTGVHTTDNHDGTVSFSAEDGYVLTDGSATTFSLAPLSDLACAIGGADASASVADANKCGVTGVASVTLTHSHLTVDAPLDQTVGTHTVSVTPDPGYKFDDGSDFGSLTMPPLKYTIAPATVCGGTLALTGVANVASVVSLAAALLVAGFFLIVMPIIKRRRENGASA